MPVLGKKGTHPVAEAEVVDLQAVTRIGQAGESVKEPEVITFN
jgi:hypothetical protein